MAELLHLASCQRTKTSRCQVEFEEADLHAPQLFDQFAEVLEHHANLILAAFGKPHLIPGILTRFDELNVRRRGAASMQRNAGCESRDLFLC